MRYDVVIVGFRLNARLKPAQALQQVLGLDAEACKELTRQFPAVVLAGASQSRANKVSEQLGDVGAKVEVRQSRLSLANEPDKAGSGSIRPFSDNEQSGNYEIGEILAPVSRKAGSPSIPAASGPAAQAKRPSREELDQALRDSFRPGQTASNTHALADAEHDAAFAGMQNFGDNLDGFGQSSAALEVEEAALRSIQRRPEAAAAARAKRPSLWTRARRFLAGLASSSLEWGLGVLYLTIVVAVTLYAVGYALDAEDALGALSREPLTESARKAATGLVGK